MPHGGNKRFKDLPMIAFDGKDRCLVNLKKGTVACYKYKRSAGASRDGRCMFIAEPLYADMMKWSACGLSAEDVTDQASWQAYLSLTMSSIEGTIRLPKKAILIMPDAVSTFETDTVSVEETADHDLTATEKKVRVKNKIWDGQVCTTGFAHGEMVLCARSPHITMGNLYLAQNAHCYDLLRYFNLTPNIICVNAIESNIQQRLNGCDYDSDSMLVTDDELIIAGVTGCYDILKVPVCKAEPVGKRPVIRIFDFVNQYKIVSATVIFIKNHLRLRIYPLSHFTPARRFSTKITSTFTPSPSDFFASAVYALVFRLRM